MLQNPVHSQPTDPLRIASSAQARNHNLSTCARHYFFVMEYWYTKILTNPDARMVSVFDLTGVTMRNLVGDALELMRALMKVRTFHQTPVRGKSSCDNPYAP